MEKNKLIPHDESISALVSGLSAVLSAGVVRLLGVIEAFSIDIGDLVSVKIGV
ncbi:hypothetical protein G9A89_017490 [Geosiphon pyriformis]|nr:hypothetical protein G9A89_017490 [Geosiphon pyriformis]